MLYLLAICINWLEAIYNHEFVALNVIFLLQNAIFCWKLTLIALKAIYNHGLVADLISSRLRS